MNKANGGDGIPVELFQILEDDAVKVLHSICQQIWKTQQWPQDWKRPVFIPVPKKGNAKECSNYRTIVLISHASKVMLISVAFPSCNLNTVGFYLCSQSSYERCFVFTYNLNSHWPPLRFFSFCCLLGHPELGVLRSGI